jgi:hypothetical protein
MAWIEELDFREISRGSRTHYTDVYLRVPFHCQEKVGATSVRWLRLGKVDLRRDTTVRGPQQFELRAYLAKGATDFEHDSASVVRLSLLAVEISIISDGVLRINACIDPQAVDRFFVPNPEYNPLEHPDTIICDSEYCDGHPIVPENFYIPDPNPELFKKVRGCAVEIVIGTVEKS